MGSSSILDSKILPLFALQTMTQTELQRYFIFSFSPVWCLLVGPTLHMCAHRSVSQTQDTAEKVSNVSSDLEDLLLQAVDTQRPLGEIQAHSVISNAVHHVQVGLWASTANGHRDAEDVDIAAAALRLMKQSTHKKEIILLGKQTYSFQCVISRRADIAFGLNIRHQKKHSSLLY